MQNNNKLKLIFGILAILSLSISIYAAFTMEFPGDLYLALRLQSINNQFFYSVMQWVSLIFGGWHSVLTVVVIGLLVWWRIGRFEAIMIPVAGILSLIHIILKLAINRPRPSSDLIQVLFHLPDNGFPSGHAIFALVILGLPGYFFFINIKNHTLRAVVLAGLIVLILMVGTSRVYLGVHWPSDVIAGYLIGGTLLTALIWFYNTRKAHH